MSDQTERMWKARRSTQPDLEGLPVGWKIDAWDRWFMDNPPGPDSPRKFARGIVSGVVGGILLWAAFIFFMFWLFATPSTPVQ